MAAYFLESSSLVKRFANEKGTMFIVRLFRDRPSHLFFASRITLVEANSALARKAHANEISSSAEAKASRRVHRTFDKKFGVVEVTEQVAQNAVLLARKHRLRGYDAVQLASAIEVSNGLFPSNLLPLIFVCSDNRLNQAAVVEGLAVEDPNDY